MDEQRALLDQLMGRERNVPEDERTNRKRRFDDEDVCKFFLIGLCPYQLFSNTKSDLGPHPNGEEDDEDMKAQFDALDPAERERYVAKYERELYRKVEELVSQCDRKVERNQQRVDLENGGSTNAAAKAAEEAKINRLVEIDKQINNKTEESEKLAEEGDVDEAQDLLNQVERLRREKETVERAHMARSHKRNIVCDVSGNIMSSTDNEERIRCHFEGKQYLGWKACRDFLVSYKEKLAKQRDSSSSLYSRGDERDSRGGRDEGRGGSRGRDDRDRGRGRDSRRDSRDRDSYYRRGRDDYGGGGYRGGRGGRDEDVGHYGRPSSSRDDRGGGRSGRRSRSRSRSRGRRDYGSYGGGGGGGDRHGSYRSRDRY